MSHTDSADESDGEVRASFGRLCYTIMSRRVAPGLVEVCYKGLP